jgi:hypothetical protein
VVARSVNDPPAGLAKAYAVPADRPLWVSRASGLLVGASDPERGGLRAVRGTPPAAGG